MTPRLAIAVIALATCLASCTGAAPPCAEPAGARLVVGIDQAEASESGQRLLPPGMLTDLPLLNADDRGRSLPGLAQSWHASVDRRTWAFIISDRLVTHDGRRLTTERLKARILRNQAALATYDPVSRDIVGIDTPTSTALVIRLARPSAALPESLRAINPGVIASPPGLGAGPYQLVSTAPAQLDFVAFPAFIGGPPRLPAVRSRYYASPRAAWAAFLRHEVDMLYQTPPALAAQLAQRPDVAVYPAAPRFQFVLGFQQASPRLRDARVRRALNMAIDRLDIARRVLAGYGGPASGPFPPAYWAAEGVEPTWRHDPVAARTELTAAGVPQDAPLELECLLTNEYALTEEIAAALEAQLARVNVRLKLTAVPTRELYRRLNAGAFETFIVQTQVGTTHLWGHILWRSGAPVPPIRANYTAADAALDAAYGALDDTAERAAVRRVHDIMREDPPAAFLVTTPMIRAVRKRWRVPPLPPAVSDIRASIPQWTLDASDCDTP